VENTFCKQFSNFLKNANRVVSDFFVSENFAYTKSAYKNGFIEESSKEKKESNSILKNSQTYFEGGFG
jgi:hypothetical protein